MKGSSIIWRIKKSWQKMPALLIILFLLLAKTLLPPLQVIPLDCPLCNSDFAFFHLTVYQPVNL